MSSSLDLGLERKHGKLTGKQRETPDMTPDSMPVTRWANSSKSIEAVKRRSPILDKASAGSGRTSTAGSSSHVSSSRQQQQQQQQHQHQHNNAMSSSSTVPTTKNVAAITASSSPSVLHDMVEQPPETLSYSALQPASGLSADHHHHDDDGAAAAAAAAALPDTSLISMNNTNHGGAFMSPSPVPQFTNDGSNSRGRSNSRLGGGGAAVVGGRVTPGGGGAKKNNFIVSPVRFFKNKVDKDVDFVFVQKQADPIKEQMRRAEAVISAIPNKSVSASLASVVDNGSAMSSAAVLDGLTRRTALLQHDKTKSDRNASAMMGCHIAALLDLSRSLALTDQNAAQVTRRVHDVLTSHVVKSVEEPLERVSLLYESAKDEVAEVREKCVDLRSELLDTQAEVQNLRRQLRRRDDVIAYLTSAYNLPSVFKDTTSENQQFISQVMAEEASPSALVNLHRSNQTRQRQQQGGGSSHGSGGGGAGGGGGGRRGSLGGDDDADEKYGKTDFDDQKSLQEQFHVVIPSTHKK